MAKSEFDSVVDAGCVCAGLRKASRMVARVYDHYLQPSDLKVTQFSLLIAVSAVGPISIGELAVHMAVDRTTLTRNIDVVMRRQFVTATPGRDARMRVIELTDKGRSAIDGAIPLWNEAQTKIVQVLGSDRWRHLHRDLSDVVQLAKVLA